MTLPPPPGEPAGRQEWRPPPQEMPPWPTPPPTDVRVETRATLVVRLLCAVLVAVSGLGLLAYEGRPASDLELVEDVRAGRVTSVVVTGNDVLWRTGALRPYKADMPLTVDERPYSSSEVAGLLARYAPDGTVDVTRRGSLAPRWLTWPRGAALLCAFLLLVSGPMPWRANRWAWFWLLSPGPDGGLGALAFLLLSGRTPGLPDSRPHARRLDGWRGFLLGIGLSIVISVLWSWLRGEVWPPTDGGADGISRSA